MSDKDKKWSGTDELMHMGAESNLDDNPGYPGSGSYQGIKEENIFNSGDEIGAPIDSFEF